MKHILKIFLFIMPLVGITAQKTVDQGYLKLEVTKAVSDNPEEAMGLEMMKGTVTEVYWNDEKYRTTMGMMGGFVKMNNIVDVEANKIDMFFDAMGNKIWVDTSLDKAKEDNTGGQDMSDYTVEYNNDVTKKILDFNVYQVIITTGDKTTTIEGYVTEEIKTKANIIQGMEDLKLKGFPLEFTIIKGTARITFSATDFKDAVAAGTFEMDPTGYTKMTPEEFSEFMGNLGGGMGF